MFVHVSQGGLKSLLFPDNFKLDFIFLQEGDVQSRLIKSLVTEREYTVEAILARSITDVHDQYM